MPALRLWALGAVLALAPLSAASAQDIVKLKDGRTLEGVVDDRGAYVLVQFTGKDGKTKGTVRIARGEILSIQLDGEAQRERDDLDVVVLLSGDELAGRVELRKNGREIALIGRHGEVLFEQRQVRAILWSNRAEAAQRGADGGAIGRTVERLLEAVERGNAEEQRHARSQLLDLGSFALAYLEERKGRETDVPEVKAVIAEVLAAAHARATMSAFLLEKLPDLPRRVTSLDPEVRLKAVKQAVMVSPKDCPPLFVHLARRETNGEVRAFLLGQLSVMNETDALGELLKTDDPGLRLAAAFALGDNGVLIGVPLVIEALKHPELEVRKLAIGALERWTGQFLAFFPDDPEEKRAEAVARWEAWLKQNGERLIDDSLRATVQRGAVTEEEKTQGRIEWTRAQALWSEIVEKGLEGAARKDELAKVRFYLQKALESYPHFVNARIALAELLYTELGEDDAAKTELEVVLRRYAEESGKETRRTVYLHLGRIALRAGRWTEAERNLRVARSLDPTDFRAIRASATLNLERALREEGLEAKARRDFLAASVTDCTEALDRLGRYRADVVKTEDAAKETDATGEQPFEQGRTLKNLRGILEELRREEADLYFQRARAYAAGQDEARALGDIERASQLVPEDEAYEAARQLWRRRVDEKQAAPAEKAKGGA